MSWEQIVLLVGGTGCLIRAVVALFSKEDLDFFKALWFFAGSVLLFIAITNTAVGSMARTSVRTKDLVDSGIEKWGFFVVGPLVFGLMALLIPLIVGVPASEAIRDRHFGELPKIALAGVFVAGGAAFIAWDWWSIFID